MAVCLSPNGSTVHTDQGPPRRLLVGTVDGVLTLEQQAPGDTWQAAGHALAGLHVHALLFEPRRGGLLAGIHGGGLYASADGGQTWTRKTRGLSPDHIWALAAVERRGAVVLYAGTQPAHLFQSTDYGESWQELPSLLSVPGTERWTFPPPPHQAHVKSIVFDPRDSATLYVGVEQGALLKSTDAGQTWRELDDYYRPDDVYYKDVHRLAVSSRNPDTLYLTGGDGAYRSGDGGETWQPLTSIAAYIGYPDALLVSPLDDQTVFVAGGQYGPPDWRRIHTANSGIVRSRDGGQTWERLRGGLPQPLRANVETMSLATGLGGFSLFAGTTDGDVFASSDQGETWTTVAHGLPAISNGAHHRDLALPAASAPA